MKRIENLIRILALCIFCLQTGWGRAQGTFQSLTITFEEHEFTGHYDLLPEYFESGFWFRSDTSVVLELWRGGVAGIPDNGTVYSRPLATVLFSATDGSIFDLVSVDIAKFTLDPPDSANVEFIGHRWDGGTVSVGFEAETPTFATLSLGPEFSGLTLVEVRRGFAPYAFDNVVVLVPEPSGSLLCLAGALLAGAWRFKGKASR